MRTSIHNETRPAIPNVIIFGQTGCGKSSLVNMIADEPNDVAKVSNGVRGCTFNNVRHTIHLDGLTVNVFDTVGLNEGQEGCVADPEAIANIYKLMTLLEDGISLLVYVVRGRITQTVQDNYKLFYEAFCRLNVRIILVHTGLEEEEDLAAWWERNASGYTKYDMLFQDHACVTTTRGKLRKDGTYVYQEEYDESRDRVRAVLKRQLQENRKPWKMEKISWLTVLVKSILSLFPFVSPIKLGGSLCSALIKFGRMSEAAAVRFALNVDRDLIGASLRFITRSS